jgi:hypothetical protein
MRQVTLQVRQEQPLESDADVARLISQPSTRAAKRRAKAAWSWATHASGWSTHATNRRTYRASSCAESAEATSSTTTLEAWRFWPLARVTHQMMYQRS